MEPGRKGVRKALSAVTPRAVGLLVAFGVVYVAYLAGRKAVAVIREKKIPERLSKIWY